MKKIKKLIFTALCIAIGVVLPTVFHTIGWGGQIFLPMHIPVLLCGLICGYTYGALCGIVTPLICSLMTGMPVLYPQGVTMMFELCAYGMISGAMFKKCHMHIALICAMICGRVINGIVMAVLMLFGGKLPDITTYLNTWVTASFITALPGIVIQLALIPTLVIALSKAGLVQRKI